MRSKPPTGPALDVESILWEQLLAAEVHKQVAFVARGGAEDTVWDIVGGTSAAEPAMETTLIFQGRSFYHGA